MTTGENILNYNWRNLLAVLCLTAFFLKSFDIVSYQITHKWEQFFHYYEGYRLPAGLAEFLPFAIENIRQPRAAKTIVFTGDSSTGGFLYHHNQTITTYFCSALTQRGYPNHTFNLALSGAHLSEQYLIINEVVDSADVVIFPVHFSFFTGRGDKDTFTLHPQLTDFLTKATQTDVLILGAHPPGIIDVFINRGLAKIWYTYKVHRILPYIVVGQPLKPWLKTKLNPIPSLPHPASRSIEINPTVAFSSQPSRTQAEILNQNRLLWEKLSYIDSGNPNLKYLRKIGELKQRSQKKFLAYFVPLDEKTLQDAGILDQNKYNHIISTAKNELRLFGIPFIDFNENNPANLNSQDFYNPDHLVPEGNRKVGEYLSEVVHDL